MCVRYCSEKTLTHGKMYENGNKNENIGRILSFFLFSLETDKDSRM